MSVKLKFAPTASKKTVEHLLDVLAGEGFEADQMFPQQKRPALRRVYRIRSPKANVAKVKKAIASLKDAVEYVEGDVSRGIRSPR